MEKETTILDKKPLNYDLSLVYKDGIDENEMELMKKIRYNLPLDVVDLEFDIPDVLYEANDCPSCKGIKTLIKLPIDETFVRGFTGSFIVDIDGNKRSFGKMFRKKAPEDMQIRWCCEKCVYTKTIYKEFKKPENIQEVEEVIISIFNE